MTWTQYKCFSTFLSPNQIFLCNFWYFLFSVFNIFIVWFFSLSIRNEFWIKKLNLRTVSVKFCLMKTHIWLNSKCWCIKVSWTYIWNFLMILLEILCFFYLFLLSIIIQKVIEESSHCFKALKNEQHFLTYSIIDFLTISTLTCWLIFIQRILNMDELSVRNIFDLKPFNLDRSRPFSRLFPKCFLALITNSTNHFSNSTKVLGFINAEE